MKEFARVVLFLFGFFIISINIFLLVTDTNSYAKRLGIQINKYDEGFSDGYASTYNTKCKIRSTLIHAYWDNSTYVKGYDMGSKKANVVVYIRGCSK